MSFTRTLRFVAAVFCLVIPVWAQVDRATLNGTLTDASGAAVPGAAVKVVARDTGMQRQTITGAGGTYSVPGLPIGTYDLTFTHEGFRLFEVSGVQLSVGQTRTVDGRLEIGAVTSQVDVKATPEMLDQSDAQIGTVIDTH